MKKLFLFVAAICASAALNAATITLEPGENKIGDAMATLADGDVIELQTGTYTEWSTLEFSTKVTLKAAEGATPIVQPNVIKIKNDFEANGITFINLSKDNYLLRTGADVAGTIAIKNCNLELNAEVTNPVPYIYLSSNTVGTLVIDNCTFAPNAKTEGPIVYGLTPVTNFTMTNSTAVACGGTDLAVYMSKLTNAVVDHCTFYNCGARVLYLKGDAMTSCTVSNCIVANAALVDQYCVATYGGTVDNVLYYNTKAPRSSDATVNGCINEDPMFVDAANGNFKLAVGSPAIAAGKDGKNIGDLRWGNEEDIPSFESLEDLVTKLPATDTNVKVNVVITEAPIDSFYVTSSGYKNGVFTHVGETVVELYTYDVPSTWEVGGNISATIQAQWGLYKGTAELQKWEGGWDVFSYTAPEPQLEEITENFFVNLEAAVGLNEQTTAAVNEGVLTVIAASEPWAAAGVKIPFDGYVKATNFAGIKASAKVPTGGVEVCAYVIDQDGKRWYQESMNSTTYADWASFAHTTVPFVTLWDGGTEEDWKNAQLVAFGFYGASGSGLKNFEINLKEIEILVGEQTALNNVKASTKAVKAVRNGMIVIERNGVRYNVLGAQF